MANKNIPITYEDFKKHIGDILRLQKLQSSLERAFNDYNNYYGDACAGCFPTLESNLITLLEVITDDKDEWIQYWAYELDYGRNYESGKVTIDNKPVSLKTVRDLWDMLTDNPHFEDG